MRNKKTKKMKKLVWLVLIMAIVACQQNKIAYVDNVKLIGEYQEKIDVEAKYKIKAEALQKKKDSLTQIFQIEAQAFQSKAQSMPANKAQEEYNALQQKGQFLGQQLQQEELALQQASQTEIDSIVSKIKRHIKDYGKSNGYTYILGGGDGGSVLYGAEASDITAPVLELLNSAYKK